VGEINLAYDHHCAHFARERQPGYAVLLRHQRDREISRENEGAPTQTEIHTARQVLKPDAEETTSQTTFWRSKMKALVIALFSTASVLLASSAHASDSNVIASVVTSGGMMAPGHVNTYKIEVLADGKVVASNPRLASVVIAKLSVAVVSKLRNDIEEVPSNVKLVEPAGKAHCMDAPGTSFNVFKASGKVVEIGAISQCIELESPEYVPNQQELMTVLKGLEILARI
jgi:hypothetical protein